MGQAASVKGRASICEAKRQMTFEVRKGPERKHHLLIPSTNAAYALSSS